ncbi:hypothetical protein ACS5PK_22310 [Roseateles sp. DB2]
MNFFDELTIAAQQCDDLDYPPELLPLVIIDMAALSCGIEAGFLANALSA